MEIDSTLTKELRALTLLNSYQLAINLLPFNKKYCEFIYQGLKEITGIISCRVCLSFMGESVGDILREKCNKCIFPQQTSGSEVCLLSKEENCIAVPVQINKNQYGVISIVINELCTPNIVSAIRNFANLIALSIENKLQRETLREQNIKLSEFNQDLEIIVRERTEELWKVVAELEESREELEQVISELTESKLKLEENEQKLKSSITESEALNEKLRETNKNLLEAKEKAEESNLLKSSFLQNISHEIRTPMNAIMGFSQLLNTEKLFDEKRKSYISTIISSSKQLLSIVTDILTISFLETKQEKVNIAETNINEIIDDLLATFKQQKTNQDILIFNTQHLSNANAEVFTDKSKLIHILSNLISNALKFTFKGFVEFGYSLKNNQLEFYVKDTGIGIEPELHQKIFEQFRQADKSIQVNYGGLGLGLSIAKGYTELLGGEIWVESELEKGAIFYFTIPFNPVNKINKLGIEEGQNNFAKVILVAEDEVFNFKYIQEVLSNTELVLIHAVNGKEAVDFCQSNPEINLVLMDIKMPELTGDKAAQIIKKNRPDLPIIAQSAYVMPHEIAKYDGIFDDYITKPISRRILKDTILDVLEK